MGIIILLLLILLGILIFSFAKIAKKSGYSKWWVIPMIIPLIGIIMIWVFAFSEWPIEKKPPL